MSDVVDEYYKNLYRFQKFDSKLNSKIKASENIRKSNLFKMSSLEICIYSSNVKNILKENIHEWLRKVEDASDKAINNVFFSPKTNETKQPSNKTKSTLNLFNQEKKNLVEVSKPDPYTGKLFAFIC